MKKFLLDRLAAYLLGSKVWGQAQAAVQIVEEPHKTGAQKRAEALDLLKSFGVGLMGFMLNLALELAVAKLRFGADR
ncbi:MAG: hypothetical protein Q7U38_14175 [Methylobacter sp.]|nr:hypothetical protein [Methylobacter sp.]MDP2169644.1 hypothetical protein [Rhodocyclaceae bacterium]MDP2429043.1 hypothetical protein [Methylobacter sp.]MDP3056544.1 hypothetical protein [Methylobacter sp.]MDP3362033.1 hypothetical protein [Methylobacter sp.]